MRTLRESIRWAIAWMDRREALMREFMASAYHPSIVEGMAELKLAQMEDEE